jgi:hypothetical protein
MGTLMKLRPAISLAWGMEIIDKTMRKTMSCSLRALSVSNNAL